MTEVRFVECGTCKAKSGTPELCHSCLNNRGYIDILERSNERWKAACARQLRTLKWLFVLSIAATVYSLLASVLR